MFRYVKTTGFTISTAESITFAVCALRFPTGVVGVFKLVLEEGIAKLLVADGGRLARNQWHQAGDGGRGPGVCALN